MAEGRGDRQGGTEMMDGASDREPYPHFRTSEALEKVEPWKNMWGGGSVGSNGKSAETLTFYHNINSHGYHWELLLQVICMGLFRVTAIPEFIKEATRLRIRFEWFHE